MYKNDLDCIIFIEKKLFNDDLYLFKNVNLFELYTRKETVLSRYDGYKKFTTHNMKFNSLQRSIYVFLVNV